MMLSRINTQEMPPRTATNHPSCKDEVGAWLVYMRYTEACDRFPGCKLEMKPQIRTASNSIPLARYTGITITPFSKVTVSFVMRCSASLPCIRNDSKAVRLSATVFVMTAIESKPSALNDAMSFQHPRVALLSAF
jgi:hypothetical protein